MNKILTKLKSKDDTETKMLYNNTLGSLLGGAYGDAAGAHLEFKKRISNTDVKNAMLLKGGGVFKVAPGQVTDDTELSIQLFRALEEYSLRENDKIDVDEYIFSHYKTWYDSIPFDIGVTTENAFKDAEVAIDANLNAELDNMNSESNGALMRCIPIAVYAYENYLTDDDIYTLVCRDVFLTHGKRTVANLVYLYVIILIKLYQHKSWDEIKHELDFKQDTRNINIFKNFGKYDKVDVFENMGWDVHAFSLVLFCLENNYTFSEAMHFVLKKGGDTDTNAAIVGGIMGAKYGYQCIPHLKKLLNYKPKHNRKAFHPIVYLQHFNLRQENLGSRFFS
jgi:ADP-ribosylglycohydrolase